MPARHDHRVNLVAANVHAHAKTHGVNTGPLHEEIAAHLESPGVARVFDLATGHLTARPTGDEPDLTPAAAAAEGHARLVAALLTVRETCSHVNRINRAMECEPDPLSVAAVEFLDQLLALHARPLGVKP